MESKVVKRAFEVNTVFSGIWIMDFSFLTDTSVLCLTTVLDLAWAALTFPFPFSSLLRGDPPPSPLSPPSLSHKAPHLFIELTLKDFERNYHASGCSFTQFGYLCNLRQKYLQPQVCACKLWGRWKLIWCCDNCLLPNRKNSIFCPADNCIIVISSSNIALLRDTVTENNHSNLLTTLEH